MARLSSAMTPANTGTKYGIDPGSVDQTSA
jgi:hypothetical protein